MTRHRKHNRRALDRVARGIALSAVFVSGAAMNLTSVEARRADNPPPFMAQNLMGSVSLPTLQVAQAMPPAQLPPTSPVPGPQPSTPADPAAPATPPAQPVGPVIEGLGDLSRLNPTGREIQIVVPLRERQAMLGDITLIIGNDDSLSVPLERLLTLLQPVVLPETLERLRAAAGGAANIRIDATAGAGLPIRYDPALLELQVRVAADEKQARSLIVTDLDQEIYGTFVPQSDFSAYVTMRMGLDFEHVGPNQGLRSPVFDGVAAFNLFTVAHETEFFIDANDGDKPFRRRASRFVWDWQDEAIRFTLGDLRVPTRGFQGALDGAGLQISRLFTILQPNRFIRPRGDQQFTLVDDSEVEVIVNGQVVRRLRLDSGSYDLSDFPFFDGSNDVQVVAIDPTGRREVATFSIFSDRQLLGTGLAEFSLSAGIKSIFEDGEPEYMSDDWFASGFIRYGLSDYATVGVNAQMDKTSWVAGAEALISIPNIGLLGVDGAWSDIENLGTGWAVNAVFTRRFEGGIDGRGSDLSLGFETRSENFGFLPNGRPGVAPLPGSVANIVEWRANGSFSLQIDEDSAASVFASYAKFRDGTEDQIQGGVSYSRRLSATMGFQAEVNYRNDDRFGEDWGARVSFTARFGQENFAQATYDSRPDEVRISYQRTGGGNVDSWAAGGDLSYVEDRVGFSGNLSYFANRGEVGFNHSTVYALDGSDIESSRSSLRAAGTIAYAGGKLAVGRPVYDGFAIIGAHSSLADARIKVDPTNDGEAQAYSDFLGPALVNTISAHSPRSIRVDAEGAPPGYDLGAGTYRVKPTYRGGYGITVGSDFSVSAVGELRNRDREAIAFITGVAESLDDPDAPKVDIFTNGAGRFSAQGLKPGRWRITMADSDRSVFVLVVPAGTVGLFRAGTLEATQ